jgi:hypothetical protein
LDEFVDAWTSLRLGELWRPATGVPTDRNLQECITKLVSRISAATGGLRGLLKLLEGVAEDPPSQGGNPGSLGDAAQGKGLAVLSAVIREHASEE